MRLYLLRHFQAEEGSPDAFRPLSAKGRDRARILSGYLQRTKLFKPDQIWHSPLERSLQSAARLQEWTKWPERLLYQKTGLLPEDDPAATLREVLLQKQELLIVGHEPHLGRLVSLLLTAQSGMNLVKLRKGSLLCLELEKKPRRKLVEACLRWVLDPELYEGGTPER